MAITKLIADSITSGAVGITVAQQWRLNTNLSCSTTNSATLINANLEQVDTFH